MPADVFGDRLPKEERPTRKSSREQDVVLLNERVAAVAADPDVYKLADLIPTERRSLVGRPGDYPPYIYVIFNALTMVFGSARRTAAHLQHPQWWQIVREGVASVLGQQEADSLPSIGPGRHHWLYNRKILLEPELDRLLTAFRTRALAQAQGQGLLDPDAPRNWSHPTRTQIVVGDGTVPKAPSKARTTQSVDADTGEIRRHRVDPGSGLHAEAGDDANLVWGPKFVLLSARSDEYGSRVILDVRHQPPRHEGGEGSIALEALSSLFPKAPGCLGVAWDGLFRGVHREAIARQGRLVLNNQHGSVHPRRIDPFTTDECRHDLWVVDGRVAERHVIDDGTSRTVPLPATKLERRATENSCRWYHLLRIPCRHGDHEHRIRVATSSTDDVMRKLNRGELLQQIPMRTRAFQLARGRRADAESTNATLDNSFWNGRMIAYGGTRQTLVMLGFAMSQNALSRYVHTRRQPQAYAQAS